MFYGIGIEQGIFTDGKGSIRLTSSLRQIASKEEKYSFTNISR
jgi:hypothetical protein